MTLVDQLLAEQQSLTAVERFSRWHGHEHDTDRYSHLMPATPPGPGEQYAFEVNLDACTGCKACVAACHSLNGLDDDEAWRDVGLLLGGTRTEAYQQTVTTACHHCADPACANGCPVGAYEKEADTGVVKHLDDQCIGCGYCVLKCPYDVPKYNEKLGIVRKCDMCVGRLREGEAPACVQACPTSAISIRVVKRESLTFTAGATMLPGAYDSSHTQPSTTYVTQRPMPTNARAADGAALRLEHAHWPLIGMLTLTQLSVGMFVVAAVMRGLDSPLNPLAIYAATIALNAGLGVSVLHLGRPMGAWRFFLGLRNSWMSREILAFSILAGSAMAACAATYLHIATTAAITISAIIGLGSVFISVMIYIDTRRPFWNATLTHGKFFGSTITMGLAAMAVLQQSASLIDLSVIANGLLFAWEQAQIRRALADDAAWHLSARLMKLKLPHVSNVREGLFPLMLGVGTCAIAFQSTICTVILLGLTVLATVLERYTFFVASMGLKMPGGYKP
jgi:Fe-S-cluster-containing dehydrogenase component/DMSO reductase anchor subunit